MRSHFYETVEAYGLADSSSGMPDAEIVGVQHNSVVGDAAALFYRDTGRIEMGAREAKALRDAFDELADGADYGAEVKALRAKDAAQLTRADLVRAVELEDRMFGYRAMIHETVHGHGPIKRERAAAGAAMEEIVTDVVARRITRDLFKIDALDAPVGLAHEGGPYGDIIEGARDAIMDAFSKGGKWRSATVAYRLLEDASFRYKMSTLNVELTADAAVERLVDNIDLSDFDASQRPNVRKDLAARLSKLRLKGVP